ncbi:MAG: hypothetical protein HYZ74_08675 [Elusimicrobia bacterium]|nr:hypothetical protein [Elusimicrobiota bacterium]
MTGLLLALVLAAPAAELGGHEPAEAERRAAVPAAGEDRSAVLEEMWQRRLLAPDQRSWAPLKRSEVREIEFDADQDSIRTRNGDVLRGRIEVPTFRFAARVGVVKDFRRSDLKRIELAEAVESPEPKAKK